MKIKKGLLIDRFSVQYFSVSRIAKIVHSVVGEHEKNQLKAEVVQATLL